jgi:hypothetical protein
VQALRLDPEKPFQICLCPIRHRDDRVRHFQGRLFQPDGKIITTTELLALPWTQRFERMDRDDERLAIVQLRQNAAKMAVPRMAMHYVGRDALGVEIKTALNRSEGGTQRLGTRIVIGLDLEPPHLRVRAERLLIAETTHLHLHQLRQLTR